MGLFPPASNPLSVDIPAIAAEMRPALEAWFSAHIQIIDPNNDDTTVHDPFADSGGDTEPTVLWDSGPAGALVQPLSSPERLAFGSQASDVEHVRVQAKFDAELGVVRAGLQIRVVDGGNDSTLTGYLLAIGKGFDSSLMWDRIFECTVVSTGIARGV